MFSTSTGRDLCDFVRFNAFQIGDIEKILQSTSTVRVAPSFFEVLDFGTVPTRALN